MNNLLDSLVNAGVQNWAGLICATRTTANQFKLADVANMFSRQLPGGDERTICWVVHPYVLAQLISMTGGDNVIFLGNDLNGDCRSTRVPAESPLSVDGPRQPFQPGGRGTGRVQHQAQRLSRRLEL